MSASPIKKASGPLLFALLHLAVPTLPGCATVTGIVTGPVVMPVSWFRLSKPRSLPADLIRAPLCLLVIPFGPLNGVLGAQVDWECFKNGGYHAILERREDPDGSVWVRRGLPFTAVFDPCAHLMRVPWEPEAGWDASSPASPAVRPSAALAPAAPRR